MIIDCVLSACNLKQEYMDCIQFFIMAWKKLFPEVKILIILIANKIPECLEQFTEHFILFDPIENISTAFISQYIRILYPCLLNFDNGVIITDIDMVPMNRSFYIDNIKDIDNNKFIYYLKTSNNNQIVICNNIAIPKIWKDIMNIHSIDDIKNRLIKEYPGDKYNDKYKRVHGWCRDQTDLYKYVIEWNLKTNNLIELGKVHRRIDRINFKITPETLEKIKKKEYDDFHIFRPPSRYLKINRQIINLL